MLSFESLFEELIIPSDSPNKGLSLIVSRFSSPQDALMKALKTDIPTEQTKSDDYKQFENNQDNGFTPPDVANCPQFKIN